MTSKDQQIRDQRYQGRDRAAPGLEQVEEPKGQGFTMNQVSKVRQKTKQEDSQGGD